MFLIILILIISRPFISSLAFPFANAIHSILLLAALTAWLLIKGLPKLSNAILYPLLLFLLSLILSLISSLNLLVSCAELYKYASGVMLFLAAATFSEEERNKTFNYLVISAAAISLLALNQYFFGFQRLIAYLAKEKSYNIELVSDFILRRRAFAVFVTPNILGGYLAMIIPLTFIYKKKAWIILLLSAALLLSKSLGAILSILLALTLYFYLRRQLNKRQLLILLGVLALSLFILSLRSSAQKPHLQPVFSTLMRIEYWKQTIIIIKAFPWSGVGPGNFNLIHSRYAHNSYLQIWAEMGIFGLASFFWLVLAILGEGLQNLKLNPLKKNTAILITASAVFLLHNSLDFSFFLPEVTFIWWAILGLLSKERA